MNDIVNSISQNRIVRFIARLLFQRPRFNIQEISLLLPAFLRFLYYSLFFITPLLMFPRTSELFEFNKMLFIYVISSLVLFSWIVTMILAKKIIFTRTIFDIPISLFLLSQILSTIFSIDRHTSFFGYYGRFNGGLLSIIAYLVLWYGFVSNFSQRDAKLFIHTLLKISLYSSFVVMVWGLPGKFGFDLSCLIFMGELGNSCWTEQFRPAERMFSTLGQPNWLGAYLVVHLFIGLYFLIQSQQKQKKMMNRESFFYVMYLVITLMILLFTRSRSSFVALVSGGALLLVVIEIVRIKNAWVSWREKYMVFVFVLVVLVYGFLQIGSQVVKKQPKLNTSVTESLDIRKIVWRGAIDLGLKYPLFGTGVETFAYAYYFVRPPLHNLTSEWDFLYNKAHNEYLNYLATTGFFGLGTYLFFIGSVTWWSIKKLKTALFSSSPSSTKKMIGAPRVWFMQWNSEVLLFIAWLTILITNFFGFSTTTVNIFFYLIPAMLFVYFEYKKEEISFQEKQYSAPKGVLPILMLIGAIILLGIYPLVYLGKYFYADILYASGMQYSKLAKYKESRDAFYRALSLRYEHVYEDKLSAALINVASLQYINQEDEEDIKKNLLLAETYNINAISSSPSNALYWKTRAKNYYIVYLIGNDPSALDISIRALEEAQKFAPTDPKIPHFKSQFYLLLADEEKDTLKKERYRQLSLEEINKAIELKPNYRDGYFFKGQLLKKYGKTDEANMTFQYILENISSQDAEIKLELEN